MHNGTKVIAAVVTACLGVMLGGACLAATITPNYHANITPAQKAVIQEKIALWQPRLAEGIRITIDFANADLGGLQFGPSIGAGAGVELFIGQLPSGEQLTLAETDQFVEDAKRRPTHARIQFNSNAKVKWDYDGAPFPDSTYDFWTVVNHEIVHAVGFTVSYTRFAAKVKAGPGDKRTYTCGTTTATLTALTPADSCTHLDSDTHPGDLMTRDLGWQTRRSPSDLDIKMLTCVWPLLVSYPALGKWGMIALLLALATVALWATRRRTTPGRCIT